MPFFGKSGTSRISFLSGSQLILLGSGMFSPGSFNAECGPVRIAYYREFINNVNARGTWPLLQLEAQRCMLLRAALHHQFHGGILVITDPTGYTKGLGFTLHEPAETNTLYPAPDDVAFCEHSKIDPSLRIKQGS